VREKGSRAAGRAISKATIIRNRCEFPLQAEHGAFFKVNENIIRVGVNFKFGH
jgi:hypothetical protein